MRALLMVCLFMWASTAQAQDCPDFYRFVDFGLNGTDGAVYRGGPTLRAESFEGEPMLVPETSACLALADLAKDGHGNPIPIVTQVFYKPGLLNANIDELSVFSTGDVEAATTSNASAHKAQLAIPDAIITRGTDFVCVSAAQHSAFTCQIVSPFKINLDLVIACDNQHCTMPILAATDALAVSARWKSAAAAKGDTASAAVEMIAKTETIHDFLKPLSSAF